MPGHRSHCHNTNMRTEGKRLYLAKLLPPEITVESRKDHPLLVLISGSAAEFTKIREELRFINGNHLQYHHPLECSTQESNFKRQTGARELRVTPLGISSNLLIQYAADVA